MIFLSQKVLRKIPGNWTFVIVTDRQELDRQIYKNFANAGAVNEPHVQATGGDHLKQLLREDHRYVFTLIQKFRTDRGETYPKLSDRSDIIVMTDEAHRTQYDIFARNMRDALPNAAFIGFTGTPLIVGEEKTRQVFGSYVSIYNFKQSVDDHATVPLYYENRIPELQLTNEDLNEDMERLLEEAELASNVLRLYKGILPDANANEFTQIRAVIAVVAEKIRSLTPEPDISAVMDDVEELLDKSVAAESYVIHAPQEGDKDRYIDLSKIDFDALRGQFQKARKRTEAEKLRTAIERTLSHLIRMNRSRMNFQEKFQQLIDEYNAGAINVEVFFNRLVALAQELTEEEKRGISENLTEEELAIFDLLTKPDLKLTGKETNQVKKVAEELLATLKRERLVLDWRKRQQSRAQVFITIEDILDRVLPPKFTQAIYHQRCESIYQHVFDSYFGEGQSVYAAAV